MALSWLKKQRKRTLIFFKGLQEGQAHVKTRFLASLQVRVCSKPRSWQERPAHFRVSSIDRCISTATHMLSFGAGCAPI